MDRPTAAELAQRLIRNFRTADLEHWTRPPLYKSQGAALDYWDGEP